MGQLEGAAMGGLIDENQCADAQILTNVCFCSNGEGGGGNNPPCYLCGSEDARFTNPDDTTEAPGFETTCGDFEALALGDSFTPGVCEDSKELIASDCLCPETGDTTSTSPTTSPTTSPIAVTAPSGPTDSNTE